MNPRPLTRSTPDYLGAAVTARARLGIAAFAEELGLDPERLKSLIWSHYEATRDDTPYADCLDRGDVILATRAELPLTQVADWIRDGIDFGGNVPCPPALQRVLDSLQDAGQSAKAPTRLPDARSEAGDGNLNFLVVAACFAIVAALLNADHWKKR